MTTCDQLAMTTRALWSTYIPRVLFSHCNVVYIASIETLHSRAVYVAIYMHFMTWRPLHTSRSSMRSRVKSAHGVGAVGKP